MVSEDEYLERIVAGIQSINTSSLGAEVNWNERIGGRQFDVVVRFKVGLMSFLVLIEVKSRTRRTAAQDIDAFVTKAGDRGANKIAFVNTAGYQRGAVEVARLHNIGLFTVQFDRSRLQLPDNAAVVRLTKEGYEHVDPELSFGESKPVTRIIRVRILYVDGTIHEMPSEASQMQYYMGQTKLADGRILDEVVRTGQLPHPGINKQLSHLIAIQPIQMMIPPDEHFFPVGTVAAVECTLEGDYARSLQGNVMVDSGLFSPTVVYTNAITDEVQFFPIHVLPLGDKRVKRSRFYFMDHPLRYFYCADVQGDTVSWWLVESFQIGQRVRAKFRQHIEYSHFYIPVTDRKLIRRLRTRLEEFDA